MKIIKATRPLLPDFDAYVQKIAPIWGNGHLSNNGPLLREFEEALRRLTGHERIGLYVNGHAALDLALKALGLTGEVITSPFTFASTVHSLTLNGLEPVFADIELESFTLNPASVESLISEKTSAILAVHIFGHPCRVEELTAIAAKHDLKLIFDGAQALGTRLSGRDLSHFGDAVMFSLQANKIVNSIEGGILACRSPETFELCERMKNFGLRYTADSSVEMTVPGLNAKMNEFQAAMGLLNLEKLEAEIRARQRLAEGYLDFISGIKGLKTAVYRPEVDYNYAYFPILVEEELYGRSRDQLCRDLAGRGIQTRKLYSQLGHRYACYLDSGYRAVVPVAEYAAERVLDLPLYSDLSAEDLARLRDGLRGAS